MYMSMAGLARHTESGLSTSPFWSTLWHAAGGSQKKKKFFGTQKSIHQSKPKTVEKTPRPNTTMLSLRQFVRFILFGSFMILNVSALATQGTPESYNVPDQTRLGGYSYGEGCLLGGSSFFGSTPIWTGNKTNRPVASLGQEEKQQPTAFVPETVKRSPLLPNNTRE